MDINNIQALIAQGLITDVASVDPNKAYVAVGVFQPGNRQAGPAGNAYPSYAMPISEFLAAGGIYTGSNGIALVGNDFQLASHNISQFTNDAGYLTSAATNDLDPVISQTDTIPVGPTIGDRYLAGTSPGAPWTANNIEEWDGASWISTAPVLDDVVFITATLSTLRYNGTAWVAYAGTAVLNQGNTIGSTLVIGTNTAQAMAFKTNNVETARVVSGGSWGFGTPTPSAKVSIKGQGSTSATMAFDVRNSLNTLMFAIRNDGNVGIGTSSPTAKLSVYGSATNYANLGSVQSVIKESATSFLQFRYNNVGDVYLQSEDVYITNATTNKNFSNLSTGIVGLKYTYNFSDYLFKSYDSGGINYFEINHSGFSGNNRFSVNLSSPTATVHIKGVDSTSSNYSLKVDNSASSPLLYVRNDGLISAPLLPTSNAGLATGDLYVDTAANILANGDKVVGWKV